MMTEYKKVSDKCFIRTSGPIEWQEVIAKPWKSKLLPDKDFFISKSMNGKQVWWSVTEGKTGMTLSGILTQRCLAIEFAERYVSYNLDRFDDNIQNGITKNGLSPRYEVIANEN